MNINIWLKKLSSAWRKSDLDLVLALFDENVTYFETPFIEINSLESLRKVWKEIENQHVEWLDFQVFTSNGEKHSVIWQLRFLDKESGKTCEYAGTYLLALNSDGKCFYFHQTCEEKQQSSNL